MSDLSSEPDLQSDLTGGSSSMANLSSGEEVEQGAMYGDTTRTVLLAMYTNWSPTAMNHLLMKSC